MKHESISHIHHILQSCQMYCLRMLSCKLNSNYHFQMICNSQHKVFLSCLLDYCSRYSRSHQSNCSIDPISTRSSCKKCSRCRTKTSKVLFALEAPSNGYGLLCHTSRKLLSCSPHWLNCKRSISYNLGIPTLPHCLVSLTFLQDLH